MQLAIVVNKIILEFISLWYRELTCVILQFCILLRLDVWQFLIAFYTGGQNERIVLACSKLVVLV